MFVNLLGASKHLNPHSHCCTTENDDNKLEQLKKEFFMAQFQICFKNI